MVAASFALANIVGPQTFQARDAPAYLPAKITILVVAALAAGAAVVLRGVLGGRNRFSEGGAGGGGGGGEGGFEDGVEDVEGDWTDREIAGFRYIY